jgi:hypothetical protein
MRMKLQRIVAQICFMGLVLVFPVIQSESAGIEIENVRIRAVEGKIFNRISEYFTGQENTGSRIILRTQQDERSGLYFILRLSERLNQLPKGSAVQIEFFEVGSSQLQTRTMMLPDNLKKTNKLFVGLTDEGRMNKPQPIAWRIAIVNAEGEEIMDTKSYLWEMPEA